MDLAKIEEFMRKEARPWPLNDVHSIGFKDIPKNTLKNALDILVKKNKLVTKQNIYCYNFKNSMNHNAEEIRQKIKKYTKKVKEKENEINQLENVLSNNNQEIAVPVLENEYITLKERVDELEIKVDALKKRNETTPKVDPSELNSLRKKYDTCLREFNKRKIIGVSMLGQIMEIYPKPKSVILEEIDVETDEMVGFNINDYPPTNDRKLL